MTRRNRGVGAGVAQRSESGPGDRLERVSRVTCRGRWRSVKAEAPNDLSKLLADKCPLGSGEHSHPKA